MKRFVFTLRPVAVLREHRELRARETFAAAVQAYVRAGEELDRARRRVAQFADAMSARRNGRFGAAAEAQNLAGYRRECAAEAEAARAVQTARAAMEQQRRDHLEAHRRLEVIRRLEDRARTAHRFETARLEQAEFDDFSSRRHSNRHSLSGP
jgi:flagellar FliJ protein